MTIKVKVRIPEQITAKIKAVVDGKIGIQKVIDKISEHNLSPEAHPDIRHDIEVLDGRLEEVNENLTKDIKELNDGLNDIYEDMTEDIDDLAQIVDSNNQQTNNRITNVADELGQSIEENVVALQEEDNRLQQQINRHSQEMTSLTARVSNAENAISAETANREHSIEELQAQIDTFESRQEVKDIVGSYEDLQRYDTTTLANNDVVKVLNDSTHENKDSFFRWKNNSFVYVGSEGLYATKAEVEDGFVPNTRTINGKELSNNIVLEVEDLDNASDYVKYEDCKESGTIALEKGVNKLKASVKVSAKQGNALSEKEDGLFAETPDLSGLVQNETFENALTGLGSKLHFENGVLSLVNGENQRISIVAIQPQTIIQNYAKVQGDNGYVKKTLNADGSNMFVEIGIFDTSYAGMDGSNISLPTTYKDKNYFIQATVKEKGNFHIYAKAHSAGVVNLRVSDLNGNPVAVPVCIETKGWVV